MSNQPSATGFTTFIKGGQTTINSLTMFSTVIKYSLKWSFVLSLLICIGLIYAETEIGDYYNLWNYFNANITQFFNGSFGKESEMLRLAKEGDYNTLPSNVLNDFTVAISLNKIEECFQKIVIIIPITILLMTILLSCYYLRSAKSKYSNQKIKGKDLLAVPAFNKAVKLYNKQQHNQNTYLKAPITIGQAILPDFAENSHMMITGTTGCGKSVTLRKLLEQIIARGDKAIILDSDNQMNQYFYQAERDIILNPFDERSKSWNPWLEGTESRDLEKIVHAMIPSGKGDSSFWNNATRNALMAALTKSTELEDILQVVNGNFKELCKYFQGTEAGGIINMESEKTAASIIVMLVNVLKSINLFKKKEGQATFSIKDWCQAAKSNILFLSSTVADRKPLKTLRSTWLELAINALLSGNVNQQQTTWIIVDELASVGELEMLKYIIAEGRKFNVAVVLAFQNIEQIYDIYGNNITESIINNCRTKLFFTADSHKTANWCSNAIGINTQREYNDNVSFGNSTYRDGMSISNHIQQRPVVPPQDIEALPPLNAYLRCLNLPIVKVHIPV